METGSPPTGWNVSGSILTSAADERTGGAGAASIDVANNGANYGYTYRAIVNAVGDWLILTGWVKKITSNVRIRILSSAFTELSAPGFSSDLAWAQQGCSARATTTNCIAATAHASNTDTQSSRADDLAMSVLSLPTLFASISDAGTADVIVGVDIVCAAGYQAGIVVNLDSAATPLNYINAYIDGFNLGAGTTRILLDEIVNGVTTNKITVTNATYVSGARLEVIRDGTSCRVIYNKILVGVSATMTANVNTRHGLFSTNAANTFDNLQVMPRGTSGEYSALNKYIEGG
jgi:hypothetical protein